MTWRLALVAIVLAIGLLTLAWAGQRRLIYFPFGQAPPPAALGLEHVEAIGFPTEDGLTLQGWFFPARSPSAHTIIVFNGNAGNRAFRAPLATALQAQGLAVLLFDYRGFGGNPGTPTEQGLAADARAARTYVASRDDVDPQRIVYLGESLGTGVATTLAIEERPAALILRSPFTSMAAVGAHHYPLLPVRWLLRDRFASIDRIAHVGCPVLVIAGEGDRIVPPEQSRQLFEAARHPKRFVMVPGADHNDASLVAGPEVVGPVVRFLDGPA